MDTQHIISKVTTPTDWVDSIVVREKPNGKLRICFDPKDLKEAIRRDHHPTPIPEEVTPRLYGSQFFTKLDAKNGYWNVELEEESSFLTTFNTPFGRYKFNRMPFGLKMSQDIFQMKIDETYMNCNGAFGIADDVQVYGKTEEEHDRNLHEAMEKTRKAGITLNEAKCDVKTDECLFYGMKFTRHGIRPNEEKVKAIKEMKIPSDKKELLTFLGLTNYMNTFMPGLAERTTSLRNLCKQDVEFEWTDSHTQVFESLKQLISSDTTLRYYDRNSPLILQVDASNHGLGACLVQRNKPIRFASKVLTPAESRYANIERELLAVLYGCERYHKYLYGRHFLIESDHKPLEQISKKHLTQVQPRLQRILLRLQAYDYEIRYKPGKEMILADALSRLSPIEKHAIPEMEVKIHEFVSVTPLRLEEIKAETQQDETLQILTKQIVAGWPKSMKEVQEKIRQYWVSRNELSVLDGICVFGSRIVIPSHQREKVLKDIHKGHLGMEKCKLRAKTGVFWPGITTDIENFVAKCEACQKYQKSQPKESIISYETPPRPWHTITGDLFFSEGEWYILIVDYYSKFPFVRKLETMTSTSVIKKMRAIISEHGIPELLITDNGTQFVSKEFQTFAKSYGFKTTTSSPHYPKGHGMIERHVQTIKRIITKCKETKDDPNLAILTLRATNISSKIPSPAELFYGRKLKTTIPSLIHSPMNSEDIRGAFTKRQNIAEELYNKNSHDLIPLSDGQKVFVQSPKDKTWSPAKVIGKAETPRSYEIEREDGSVLRRNRTALRPVPDQEQRSRYGRLIVKPKKPSM